MCWSDWACSSASAALALVRRPPQASLVTNLRRRSASRLVQVHDLQRQCVSRMPQLHPHQSPQHLLKYPRQHIPALRVTTTKTKTTKAASRSIQLPEHPLQPQPQQQQQERQARLRRTREQPISEVTWPQRGGARNLARPSLRVVEEPTDLKARQTGNQALQ